MPLQIRHGEQDRFVPVANGRWLAGQVAAPEVHISAEDSHISLIERHLPSAQGWLAERLG